MKHLISIKSLVAVALAMGAIAATSSVQAASDVHFSIGVQVPGIYVQPTPVYVQPQSFSFYTPAPVYYQRYDDGRHHGGRQWHSRGPYGDRDRDGIANIYDQGGPRNQWRQAGRNGPYGDLDRDGIVNQRDRDRDGDGVSNRFDRFPNNPYRR
jgi:hypothetical protein